MLDISDLSVSYEVEGNDGPSFVHAVDGVSFEIKPGESFGLVGESGCGKSTVAETILQVLPDNARIDRGTVEFDGRDLTRTPPSELRTIRWEDLVWIPQAAMDGFDPVYTIRRQIHETVRAHRRGITKAEINEMIADLFETVGIDPERADEYPHQFSGGMKQRAMIVLAMILDPDLIIADEPTTALDVINQDKILYYLEEVLTETGASLLLITHDMSVVADLCDRMGVMYSGRLVEVGRTEEVINEPLHPYTMGLKNAFPTLFEEKELITIPGSPERMTESASRCLFANRCPFTDEQCEREEPPLESHADRDGHSGSAACFRLETRNPEEMRAEASRKEAWIT